MSLTGPSFTGETIDQPNQFICSGFPGTNLSVTGGTVGIDYALQWQRSINAGTTYTDIPLATGETYNTGNVSVSTYFRRRVMHTGGGTCEQFSSVFIDEISDLDLGSLDTSIDTNICYNESPGTSGRTKFGNSIQVSLSQEAQLGSFSLGISQQASKLNTFSLTSIGFLVGASVENFDFGLQYNIPIK
ncbi:hypothetical protein N9483_02070 [Flavobacteriaceae bacterium]|nr:hypothetical protein [Flavobacteriaceae bacterium]